MSKDFAIGRVRTVTQILNADCDFNRYRHVHVTKEVAKLIPHNRLMSESEWRSLGIQQSPGTFRRAQQG